MGANGIDELSFEGSFGAMLCGRLYAVVFSNCDSNGKGSEGDEGVDGIDPALAKLVSFGELAPSARANL
jgi:hypothetical protein